MTRADVCLILEGTYPYVRGGVASWTHEMILRHDHLKFHVVSLLPRDDAPEQQFKLPANVIGHSVVHLQRLHNGKTPSDAALAKIASAIELPLERITTSIASLADFRTLFEALSSAGPLSEAALLNSQPMWDLLARMYEKDFDESSMLDYFWSWRAVLGGMYSVLEAPLPDASVYHALSTGYAGLMLARAKLETKRPALITEHGIYTNERRIEIALADWLIETASKTLSVDRTRLNLRDLWIDSFTNYSRIAYQAADQIVTLFAGNQPAQIQDGADSEKMRVIPNGVDIERFAAIQPKAHARPTVALIGRVVPIKDAKNFLRAVASLRDRLPDIRALIIGPTEEDPAYAAECQSMVEYLALKENVIFTGQVKIDDWLPEIDVVILSSLSEAQPLVVLEAGAAGVPTVATDVGACREMILGRVDESPHLGAGGAVVALGSPQALADAALQLLTDRAAHASASQAIRQRVATYYDKNDQMAAYRELYAAMG